MSGDTSRDILNDVLARMGENRWITYLPTANLVDGIFNLIKQNSYLVQFFNKSIYAYEKDDFTVGQLPGMCIYRAQPAAPERQQSKTSSLRGDICFDVYLPTKLDRTEARRIFDQIFDILPLVMQQQSFFDGLHQYLVPLPSPVSSIYNDVLNWYNTYGSWLLDFAKNIEVVKPTVKKLSNNEDVWYGRVLASYYVDRIRYYQFLEAVGINFAYDPNQVIYGDIEGFEEEITIKNSDNSEEQIIG